MINFSEFISLFQILKGMYGIGLMLVFSFNFTRALANGIDDLVIVLGACLFALVFGMATLTTRIQQQYKEAVEKQGEQS